MRWLQQIPEQVIPWIFLVAIIAVIALAAWEQVVDG